MKTVNGSLSLIFRLSITATALLIGQQALAAGTAANTPVNNRATVGYSVNTVPQGTIESSPTGNSTPGVAVPGAGEDTVFVVDRRVDFLIQQVALTLTQVDVGQTDQVVEYLLVNNSNSALDFSLSALNGADGTNTGRAGDPDDDEDVVNLRWHVSAESTNTAAPGTAPDPVLSVDPVDVINLAADDSIRIFVFADIPGTLPDGSIANIELSATAAEPNTGAGTLLVEVAGTGDPLVVENVWTGGPVAPGSNYTETQLEGYEISSATLTITKTNDVVWDPINLFGGNAKAIPGAIIEYSIAIANGGGTNATGIVITDAISAEVAFLADSYAPGQDISYDIDGGAASFCNASDGDGADGCALSGANLTVDGTGPGLVLVVAPAETLNVKFRVQLPAVP